MGLLDDAIREHLDLKRRRGADPAEIERAEQEALGPVRRNRDPAAADDPAALLESAPPRPGVAYDEPDEPIASDLAEEDYDDEFEDAQAATPLVEERRPVRAPEPAEELDEDEPFDDEPQPFTDDATRVMRSAAAGENEDEDVLEETPEFLQDTPDHDRLWFEQRPPRDFDFDN